MNPWTLLLDVLGTSLAFFYDIIPEYGIAIILLTISVSLLLFPLTVKQTRSMKGMQEIQPEVKRLPHYPIPVFLIAQLAVHSEFHGKGLGKITLIKALEYLWEINAHMRAFAVIVDCLNGEAQEFYAKYDFEVLCQHNGRTRMFMPMKTVAHLFE